MAQAGFGKSVITPPLGVELSGYGVFLQRRATSIRDDLFVRALALQDEAGEQVLLLALDLLGLDEQVAEDIVSQVHSSTGLASDRVLVSCIHTHSGPATASLVGWGVVDPAYVATLPGHCVEAALLAMSSLAPVRIGSAHGTLPALGFNRVRSGGPLDPAVHVVRIESLHGEPRAVLFSHACHPVTIDRHTPAGQAISADWPGQVARRLNEEGYGEALFLLGPCGDIDPIVAWHNFRFEGMELSAELVAQSLLGLLQSVECSRKLSMRVARANVRLPLQPLTETDVAATLAEARTRHGSMKVGDDGTPDGAWDRFYAMWAAAARAQLAAQPKHIAVPLTALLLNDEAWLHLPGEVFTSLGRRIRDASPFPHTNITTLAAHYIGYIPDGDGFASDGYASCLMPRILQVPPYSPSVGDKFVEEAVDLLRSISGGRE